MTGFKFNIMLNKLKFEFTYDQPKSIGFMAGIMNQIAEKRVQFYQELGMMLLQRKSKPSDKGRIQLIENQRNEHQPVTQTVIFDNTLVGIVIERSGTKELWKIEFIPATHAEPNDKLETIDGSSNEIS